MKIFENRNEEIGFYTRDNKKTNKRINVNSFFSVDFPFFNEEFKIVFEIFHLFIATNHLVKV